MNNCGNCGKEIGGRTDHFCQEDESSARPAGYGAWHPIETLTQNDGPVLLFAEVWKDEDFNPEGIREGFRNEADDGPIFSAAWNPEQDYWMTIEDSDATHWMRQPKAP